MPGASFTAAGYTALNFSVNPSYPGKTSLNPGLVRLTTEGGEDISIAKGDRYMRIELKFVGLPAGDFDGGFNYASNAQSPGTQSLVNWFISLSGTTFTYLDPFGNSHSVAFDQDTLDFSLTEDGTWDGIVTLKETIG